MRNSVVLRRWEEIQKQIAKLEKRHAVHIASYGEGNERRLTGKHETSSMHDFRCAQARRDHTYSANHRRPFLILQACLDV